VSLDSVVYAWLSGESPDGIVDCFPSLGLDEVQHAIEYYQAHRKAVDEYLERGEAEFQRLREESRLNNPALYSKLEAGKREMLTRRR
jgi:hypothetical protein